MVFIDVHCHLEMIEKEGIEIKEIVGRAEKKNVIIVWCGVGRDSNRRIINENKKYKNVLASPGLYPVDALNLSELEIKKELEFIEKNSKDIVAIGEVGLDFKEQSSLSHQILKNSKKFDNFKEDRNNQKRQEETFRKIIRLAIKINKPLIVHSRKAELRCIEILEEENAKKAIMHCFSGKLKLIDRIVKNGWLLSIPTSVKNSEHFKKIIEMVDIGKLFCESDSPYLHPEKKFPNLPENIVVSYEEIARIKNLKIEDVEKIIGENWERLQE